MKNETNLKYLSEVYQFDQLIIDPTRVVKDSITLIDHAYTTHTQLSRDSGVIPLGFSNHHMVFMILKHRHPNVHYKHTEIQYRSYKTLNKDAFQHSFRQLQWSILEDVNDPDRALFMWKDLYTAILDKHAPIKYRRIKTDSSPWLNDYIITAMQKRDSVHEQAQIYNTSELWLAYRNARNNVGEGV